MDRVAENSEQLSEHPARAAGCVAVNLGRLCH